MLNAIGIPSKGVPYFLEHTLPLYCALDAAAGGQSISAPTAEGFAEPGRRDERAGRRGDRGQHLLPQHRGGRQSLRHARRPRPRRWSAQLRAATRLPLWAKLTPNTGDIAEVARAAEAAGADALVVANTILAMAIDLHTFRPRLGNVMGGLSGPAIKPIVLRQVYQCARAVRVPIIGCGGIATAADAAEYMLAGATAVQVGTATFLQPGAMIDDHRRPATVLRPRTACPASPT